MHDKHDILWVYVNVYIFRALYFLRRGPKQEYLEFLIDTSLVVCNNLISLGEIFFYRKLSDNSVNAFLENISLTKSVYFPNSYRL